MRASLLVLTIAAAGCYSPALQPCELACAASRECPDGLTCNGQNACALTDTAICDQLPIDAPMIDSFSPRVTVEVRTAMGGPLAGATVVFADAAGALVAEVPTGADGRASVDMLPGGSATVIRTVMRPGGGTDQHVTTYLDLWPGAHVITQSEVDARVRNVTIVFNPPTGTHFIIYTSCSPVQSTPNRSLAIAIPERCPMFDVIITSAQAGTVAPTHAAFVAAQTGTTITVPDASWQPVRSLSGQLIGLPTNASRREYGARAWVTAGLPATPSPIAAAIPTPTSAIGPLVLPTGTGIAPLLTLDFMTPTGAMARQVIADRRPATAQNLDQSYDGIVLPWLGNATFDAASRRISVPMFAAQGTTTTEPAFFEAVVLYPRNPMPVIWRIIGSASRINVTGGQSGITYPDIPGSHAFEPNATDLATIDLVTLFHLEPEAVHDVIEIRDIVAAEDGYFKIPTLRHLTSSISQ